MRYQGTLWKYKDGWLAILFWSDPIFITRLSVKVGLTRKQITCCSRIDCIRLCVFEYWHDFVSNTLSGSGMKRSLTILVSCTIYDEVRKTTEMFNQTSQSWYHRCNTALSDGQMFVASLKIVVRLVFVILMPYQRTYRRKEKIITRFRRINYVPLEHYRCASWCTC